MFAENYGIHYKLLWENVRSGSCHIEALKGLGFALDKRVAEGFRGAE